MEVKVFERYLEAMGKVEIDWANGKVLDRKTSVNKAGYEKFYLEGKIYFIHQLIAVKKFGMLIIGMTVDHVNNNHKDNRWDNISLLSKAENTKKSSEKRKGLVGKRTPIKVTNINTGEVNIFPTLKTASEFIGCAVMNVCYAVRGDINLLKKKYKAERLVD